MDIPTYWRLCSPFSITWHGIPPRSSGLLHPLEEQLALQPSLTPSHCRCARITPPTEEVPHVHQASLNEPFHGLDCVHTKGFASRRQQAVVDVIDRFVKKSFKAKTQTELRIPLRVLPGPRRFGSHQHHGGPTTVGIKIRQKAT
eukprot:scaffold411_cov171-Ochromonas_danica.AAC.2